MSAAVVAPLAKPAPDLNAFDVFPVHLRPGHLVTMQPVDAAHERGYYINNPAYCGQPKRNGHRMVVWAVPEAVAWQARGRDGPGLVKASPSKLLDDCLRSAAQELGPFLLDGEIVWLDVAGLEHRTAPQAATANVALGQPEAVTLPTYAVFEALYDEGSDLTPCPMITRFSAGAAIVSELRFGDGSHLFEFLEPVYMREAKQALADRQVAEGREGEVWRLTSAPYSGGKQSNGRGQLEPMVRTKYSIHPIVRVTGFSLSGAVKVERRFAAIQVADPVTGKKMGSIGTGFTIGQQDELLAAFAEAEAQGRPLLIRVTAADLTESGILYQGRYEKLYEFERNPLTIASIRDNVLHNNSIATNGRRVWMNIDGKMSDFVEIEDALPLLSQQIGKKVARATAAAWIAKGYLPGVRLSGGKTVLIPKSAIALFPKPIAGRYASRQNLAIGIGIALKCIGEVEVPLAQGIANAKCPRCGNPWVIRGGIPVPGHEGDCCCCNLACLYIGPDFLLTMTPDLRVTRGASVLTFRV